MNKPIDNAPESPTRTALRIMHGVLEAFQSAITMMQTEVKAAMELEQTLRAQEQAKTEGSNYVN